MNIKKSVCMVFLAVTVLFSSMAFIPVVKAQEKTAKEWADELGVPEASIVFPSGGGYKEDNHRALAAQEACNYITFLPGKTYYLDFYIDPGSGLRVRATDATIILRRNSSFFYDKDRKKPKYTNTQNVVIEGGTWQMLAKRKPGNSPSAIKFVHAENITLKNMKVITNYALHMVELIGVRNCLIEGCSFKKAKKHYYPTRDECIQLDYCSGLKNARGIYPDKTACRNIRILNNEIYFHTGIGNVPGGGAYYSDITVSGNSINATKGNSIYAHSIKNLTVENNTFNSTSPAALIFTKNITGKVRTPLTMNKLTVAPALKANTSVIKGVKDRAGSVTATIGELQYFYYNPKKSTQKNPYTSYKIKVPALAKGSIVKLMQLCKYGNVYKLNVRVK